MSELTAWRDYLRSAHRSPQTIDLRAYHVRRLARELPGGLAGDPYAVQLDQLAGWLAGHDFAAETIRSYRASWGTFYKWAMVAGRTDRNPAALLPTITPPRGVPKPAPEAALTVALAAADRRVRLMVLLGALVGLRRGEIAAVHTRDVEADLFGAVLRVHGKGGVVRRVPLASAVVVLLGELPPGWAFPSPAGGHLTPAHVGRLMRDVLPPGVTPHMLRHRFASRAYAAERDLRAVQELLGHARSETTDRYTAVPLDAGRRAVEFAASGH